MFISTGNINTDYTIIDTIFAMDSHKEGFFTTTDPNKAFEGVKQQLMKKCAALGGDGVISCQFEYRVAVNNGVLSSKQVIEIFAYGTVVKLQ